MKKTLKTIAQYTGLLWVSRRLRRWRDNMLCDRFECSIGDILLLRDVPNNNQLLLTTRLMDVEVYLSGENKKFPYQNAISYKAYGDKHRENDGNRSFTALIESYLKEGYHSDSYITCDKDMRLMDGNHRMGLHIHEKIDRINVRRLRRINPFSYGGDWYYEVGLPTYFMESVYAKFDEIQQWLIETGNTFLALFVDEVNDSFSVEKDLSRLTTPLHCYEGEIELNSYDGADYHNVKWNKALLFSLNNPEYYVKKGQLHSQRIDQIRAVLKRRYGDSTPILLSNNCREGNDIFLKIHPYLH